MDDNAIHGKGNAMESPYNGIGKFLFVSRVQADEQISNELIALLQNKGVNVWYDTEYEPIGDRPTAEWLDRDLAWERQLVERLGNSAGVVILLSEESGHDSHIARQLKFALSHKKPVAVAQLDTAKPDAAIELNVGLTECVSRTSFEDDAAFIQAIGETEAVKTCLLVEE